MLVFTTEIIYNVLCTRLKCLKYRVDKLNFENSGEKKSNIFSQLKPFITVRLVLNLSPNSVFVSSFRLVIKDQTRNSLHFWIFKFFRQCQSISINIRQNLLFDPSSLTPKIQYLFSKNVVYFKTQEYFFQSKICLQKSN